MGKKSSGITRDKDATQDNLWQVDKWIYGERIRRRGFFSFEEADEWLNRQIEERRALGLNGKAPSRTFEEAAAKHVSDNVNKVSLDLDIYLLKLLLPYLGHLELEQIHQSHIDAFVADRVRQKTTVIKTKQESKDGKLAPKTANLAISLANTILGRAATEWRHENNLPWLSRLIKLKPLSLKGKQRPPRPILWDEQEKLLAALPQHLRDMALFSTNTGARDNVVCSLRWEWETRDPEFPNVSVFIVPKKYVKGQEKEAVIVCNSEAQKVIERCRGRHKDFVFVYRRPRTKNAHRKPAMPYRPIQTMNNTAWQRARKVAGLGDLHVHDLRHTFATRLRAAGVPEATISDLLWHQKRSMTGHYADATVAELLAAVEKVARNTGNQNRSLRMLIQQHQLKLSASTVKQ